MEPQVGAAKGDDPGIKTGARRRGEAVGPSARAEDRVPGPRLAAFVAQSHASPSESDRVDRAARRDGRADGGLALEHAKRGAGPAADQLARDGEADDAAADDCDVTEVGWLPAGCLGTCCGHPGPSLDGGTGTARRGRSGGVEKPGAIERFVARVPQLAGGQAKARHDLGGARAASDY